MRIEEVGKNSALLEETEKGKEKILLQVVNGDEGGFKYSEFYTIDMRNHQVLECPYALLADLGWNYMVSIGSVVYVVGGGLKPEHIRVNTKPPHSECTKKGIYHKCISYLDLANDTGDGWKPGPCLSEGPSPSPAAVSFGALNSVFAYYPAGSRWELVLESFRWSSKLVFVDGVIFIYLPEDPEFILAYDVASKQWLNNVFATELPDRVWRYEFDAMIYLGNGIMCLACDSTDISPPQTHVYLIKFKFERSTHNPTDLLITLLPEEAYTIGVRTTVNTFLPI